MKKIFALFLVIILCFSLISCGEMSTEQDDSPLTMYVGLGLTNSDYYTELHEAILLNTGIDVQYVYTNTLDTTSAMGSQLSNYDLPADIIITANLPSKEAQTTSLLDLASYTNIPDLFSSTKRQEVSVDGAIYMLPFTTRLIGIEYNKTLLKELGLTLPNTWEDMVSLKEKVESAGYTFAVSGAAATGHGFNYLFYVMGTEYIFTPDGTAWLNDFLEGKTDVSSFREASQYFQKYVESGLLGNPCSSWSSAKEFKETRALFYYNITNDALPDENGDEFGTMPWISENGSTNCFVDYNCMYIGLDKKLAESDQADKLEKATTVLKFMTTYIASDLFTDLFPDGFVGTNSFTIGTDRIYQEYSESIVNNYTMPWYYNYFDTDTIVAVGQLVNDYVKGTEGVTLDDIMDELEKKNLQRLNKTNEESIDVKETFDYPESAKLQAIANAYSLQDALDSKGVNEEVSVSILPYVNSLEDLPIGQAVGVVQQKLYKGTFSYTLISSLVNKQYQNPVAIKMTGTEIKALVEKGYSISEDFEKDVCFPYMMVTKDNMTLEDEKTYVVAIAEGSMTKAEFEQLSNDGKVLQSGDKVINGNTSEGIRVLFERYHDNFSPEVCQSF